MSFAVSLNHGFFPPHEAIKSKATRYALIFSLSGDLDTNLHLRVIRYHCASKAKMLFSGRRNVADNFGHFAVIPFMPTCICSHIRLTVTHSHQALCSSNSPCLFMERKRILSSAHLVPVNCNSVSRLAHSQSDRVLLRCLRPLTFRT